MATKTAKKSAKVNSAEQRIIEFCETNGITFEYGRRNSDSVIIAGYSLYLGCAGPTTAIKAIKAACPERGNDWEKEFRRVFEFAEGYDYGAWWYNEFAHSEFVFE